MGQLMLVNPRRRKRRKMTAKQKVYFGNPRRRKRTSSARRRRRSAAIFSSNPRRRRRRSRVVVVTRNPRRRRYVSRRRSSRRIRAYRNPRGLRGLLGGGFVKNTLMPAAIGGAGAVAVDIAWAMAPVPASLKTGTFAPVVKVGGAILLGMLVSKFASREIGAKIVSGYLTVQAASMIKGFVQKTMPTLPLSDYNTMGWVNAGQVIPDYSGMNAYVPDTTPPGDNVAGYINGYGDEVF